jgi:hypothetical protein
MAFETDLQWRCRHTFLDARSADCLQELAGLSGQLRDLIDVELAILGGDEGGDLLTSWRQFNDLAASTMQDMSELLDLYAQDLRVQVRRLSCNLSGMRRHSPERCADALRAATGRLSIHEFREHLLALVDETVCFEFDAFSHIESAFAEESWQRIVEGLRTGTEVCLNELRAHINELIGTQLPPVVVPAVETWLLLPAAHQTETLDRVPLEQVQKPLGRILVPSIARHRLFGRLVDLVSMQMTYHVDQSVALLERRLTERYWWLSSVLATSLGDTVRLVQHGISRAEELRRLDPPDRLRRIEEDLAARATAHVLADELATRLGR